jgi:arylsulfatase A
MKFFSFHLLFLLLLTRFHATAQQKKSPVGSRPNIILIIADDLGYGDLSCYGQQKFKTPNLDKLAAEGMRFTQFYSGSTVCAPARATLMTGLHTGHSPIRGNRSMQPEGQFPLPDSTVTIAAWLKKMGYTTGAFGKWGMGPPASAGEPLNQGFDQFYGYLCQAKAHNYYPPYVWNNREKEFFPSNEEGAGIYSADTIHRKALQFLEQQKPEQPFFLFLPYTIPHGDVMVPHDEVYEHYKKQFAGDSVPPPPAEKRRHKVFESYPHAGFAAMVSRLDRYVGEVVAQVQKMGLAENTLVLFTSDNGPHRENGGDPEFFDGNGIYKGIKRDLYEGGIRVPFIAWWPGTISKKQVNNDPLILYDIFPTLQELAGIPVSQHIDGISMVPALTGKKQPAHAYLYWEFHEQGGKQAVRLGNWKGIRLNVSTQENPPIELYNLDHDPVEENNVADKHPDIVKQIEAIMQEAHVPDRNWPLLPSEKK